MIPLKPNYFYIQKDLYFLNIRQVCYETIMFGRVTQARRRLRREGFSVYLIYIL